MTPRQRLQILLLGIAGALCGFGFIWLATFDERDESRCRLCNQRNFVHRVTIVKHPNESHENGFEWQIRNAEGAVVARGSWPHNGETVNCYCGYCQRGWHSDNPPKRQQR